MDTSGSPLSGDLVQSNSADPSYISDCQWSCAECTVLSSDAKSSDGGQYFSVPTLNLGKMSAEAGFSICAWFTFDSMAAWTRIFDFGEGASSGRLMLARNDGSDTLRLDFKSRTSGNAVQSLNPISQGTWRHICISNQRREWVLYDNGIRSESLTANFDLDSVDLSSNFLGRSNWGDDPLLMGKLDDFRLYSKALSWKEVADVFAYSGNVSSADYCTANESTRTALSGSISDGPSCYQSLAACRWIIAPPGAGTVTLTFVSLSTERNYDFVRVFSCATANCVGPYEILELSDSPFSGSTIPGPVTSSTGVMMITLTSDSSVENSGFSITYTSQQLQCIPGLYVDMGAVPSPNLPSVLLGDSALFAYYTFGTDSRLKDSSHASVDLVPSSEAPTYVSDCRWPSAECSQLSSEADSSGGGQYFTLPTVNLGKMSAEAGFSICSWFMFDTVREGSRVFDMGNGEYNNNVFLAREGGSDRLYAEYWNWGSYQDSISSPNAIVEGVWRHACLVNQGRIWALYDDGVQTVHSTANFDLVNIDLSSNHIGRSSWGGDMLMQGKIDEFRMYSRALDMTEVSRIVSYKGRKYTEIWTRKYFFLHFSGDYGRF
jgi:hypothetical protein